MRNEAVRQARHHWVLEELASGRAQATVRRAGRSNADVARVCKVTTPSVWRWFNDDRRPRMAAALRLADYLDLLELEEWERR